MPPRATINSVLLFLLLTSVAVGSGQDSPRELLGHLGGRWSMKGTVRATPVEYFADGSWTLQEQFLSFHMKDAAVPPRYEASLLIGIDSTEHQFVGHWLDSFGGGGARVVGVGPLTSDSIRIIYPYAAGSFRNTFGYDRARDSWTLLIESQDTANAWSVFARYTFVRKP